MIPVVGTNSVRLSLRVEVSKKAQRAAILKMLRTEMTPSQRQEQSKALCSRLVRRVEEIGASPPTHLKIGMNTMYPISPLGSPLTAAQLMKAEQGIGAPPVTHIPVSSPSPATPALSPQSAITSPTSPRTTIHLCSFLPMYFEPDLVKVFEALWTNATSAKSSSEDASVGYRTYVPRMMPVAATGATHDSNNVMHFVEVMDANDLEASFLPQGKYHIREVTDAVWTEECLSGVDGNRSSPSRSVLGHAFPSPSKFTDCFLPAECFTKTNSHTSSSHHHHHMVLLCPATAFDDKCGRIGKGAGYYDRYLEDAQRAFFTTDTEETSEAATNTTYSMTAIGVGFNEQLIANVVMESNDIFMDEVVTPLEHFLRGK